MTQSNVKIVSSTKGNQQANLSKGQKVFNNLVKQIEKMRKRLGAWEQTVPSYQQKYLNEWAPLIESSMDLRSKLVYCLDRAYDQRGLTKTDRRAIANLITELAGELVAARNDPQMKALYNQYSHSDYDSEEAANLKGMQSVLEGVLGVALGDDLDLSSPDDLFARAQEKMHANQREFAAERQAREKRQTKRAKSAKQLAFEARQQAEAHQLSGSIREVYRKLVSALHPDREADPHERDRKTALMQRVNQAYDKQNLLQLLELQLELEHIDQSAINNLSEDRLKHYNKILKDQLAELEQEIHHAEGGFRAQFDIPPFVAVSPSTIMRDLASDIVSLQSAIRDLERDLLVFDDANATKAWVKHLRCQSRVNDFDERYF